MPKQNDSVSKAESSVDGNGEATREQRKAERIAKRRAARQAERQAETGLASESKAKDDSPQVVEIRPMARKASMRKRHWGLALGFFLIVVAPLAALGYYLLERATDQYASVAGFSVRQEENSAPSTSMLGGLAGFVGGGGNGDSEMLFQYIQSQDLVSKIDQQIDLRTHYTAPYNKDPFFALKPGSSIEDLLDYWKRVVRVSYDPNSQLITLNVLAFDPDMARRLAETIVADSQILVNELNAKARADALKYAQQDLEESVARLKSAREALVQFRTKTQIVDPQSDMQGRMGVLNSLQQQLAQALIDYDLLAQSAAADDPRVAQAQRRIDVIRARIADERSDFSTKTPDNGNEGYPNLLAEYESLSVDQQFAEESYRVALAALDSARANADRQTKYLATYVKPTLPQTAEYPKRLIIFALGGLFLFLLWSILALMYYAVRDRK